MVWGRWVLRRRGWHFGKGIDFEGNLGPKSNLNSQPLKNLDLEQVSYTLQALMFSCIKWQNYTYNRTHVKISRDSSNTAAIW